MPERILIVDDAQEITDFCIRVLRRYGYEVIGSGSPEEALRILAQEHYDLLITDVMMPGSSGLELLAKARQHQPDLRAIIITGFGTMEIAVKALRIGASDFITKPFGIPDLLDATERALDQVRESHQQSGPVGEERLQSERLATLDRLGAGVAHELRNPLGVINNSVYYLKSRLGEQDPKITRYLGIISHEIEASNRVITNLADLSQARNIVTAPVDPNVLVERALERALLPIEVTVHTSLATDLPQVHADVAKMQQAFLNLIANAIEAMPSGGKLTISTNRQDGQVEFCFEDTGIGIPAENLERIFEPLFTTKTNGMGLGLALARVLIESHRGEIAVSSRPGIGSRFTVHLPCNGEHNA